MKRTKSIDEQRRIIEQRERVLIPWASKKHIKDVNRDKVSYETDTAHIGFGNTNYLEILKYSKTKIAEGEGDILGAEIVCCGISWHLNDPFIQDALVRRTQEIYR